jgi:DNA-3-methyladenine glycosylase II
MEAPMSPRIMHDEPALHAAAAELAKRDSLLARALEIGGLPGRRRRPSGFPGLVAVVCGQQLSVAAANSIQARLEARLGCLEAPAFVAAAPEDLRACGLSAAKVRTLRAVAEAMAAGAFDLDALDRFPPDAAHAALTSLPGIGPWTADIYLLFCLGHADIWPAGDLALQHALRDLLDLPERPSLEDMQSRAEGWRPTRGVAALMLWTYYRARRAGRSGAPL